MTTPWRTRLDRADKHLEELDIEIDRFIAGKPYSLVSETHKNPLVDNLFDYRIVAHVHREPPEHIGEIISDCVGKLRSALDLIAYRLASPVTAGVVRPAPSGTEFPIFWRQSDFLATNKKGDPLRGSGLFKVRGMSNTARRSIESIQPYNGIDPADYATAGADVVPDSVYRKDLFLLNELRRIDFHREPHITGAIGGASGIGINRASDVRIHIHKMSIEPGAFNEGAVVARIEFNVTGPNPEVQMNPRASFGVAFDQKGPARGQLVVPTLRRLRDYIEGTVFPQLEPFV